MKRVEYHTARAKTRSRAVMPFHQYCNIFSMTPEHAADVSFPWRRNKFWTVLFWKFGDFFAECFKKKSFCGNELVVVNLDTEHGIKHKVILLCGGCHISNLVWRLFFNKNPTLHTERVGFERREQKVSNELWVTFWKLKSWMFLELDPF